MEIVAKKNDRSLAYRLAKVIDNGSLSVISGGNQTAGVRWTSRETLSPSGSSMNTMDIVVDISVDF